MVWSTKVMETAKIIAVNASLRPVVVVILSSSRSLFARPRLRPLGMQVLLWRRPDGPSRRLGCVHLQGRVVTRLQSPVMRLSGHVPDLGAIEVLLAVARAGSLNGASAEVGVSQQAVSARMRSIEAQTGVVLLRRGARGSQLTSEGVVVAEWAARLMDVAAQFDAGLASLRQDRRRRLRVSASQTIAEQLLPGWLVAFRLATQRGATGPTDLELTAVNSETAIAHVRDGRADLGFVEGPRVPAQLRSRVVGH